jgi:ATPase family associated with various cellular activities (AAA)/AAA lid domain
MQCEHIMHTNCSKGHQQQWKCHSGPPPVCDKCDREAKLAEKKKREDFSLQEKRDAEQQLHARRLAEIDAKIASEMQARQDARLTEERERVIRQREKDLEVVTSLAAPKSPIASAATPQVKPPPPLVLQGETLRNGRTQGSELASGQPKTKSPEHIKTENSTVPAKPIPKQISPAQEEWERQKNIEGASNGAIDAIMGMTGLEDVKDQVLRIKVKIDTTKRQNTSLKDERFNVVLLGNPGTGNIFSTFMSTTMNLYVIISIGKTTVARHYANFLTSVQVISGDSFVETTGSRLANDGVPGIKKTIEGVVNAGGGVIFVDEAYQLTSQHNAQGNQVLDFMLAEMENRVGTVVFILAGYNKEMEKFFEHNPGLTSRVPYRLQFKDYTDAELLDMLEKLIEKTYTGNRKMTVEEGIGGLYGRITIRRLGKGRGREGFGNARALHNLWSKIRERQAGRLNKERRAGLQPDDFFLAKEDLIGPDPSKVMKESTAWKDLQSLIGLKTVKESVRNLFDLIDTNYRRELIEKNPLEMSLNRVFLGSPGTGKTTVAKLYGQILADLGLVSNGEGEII